MAYATIPKDLTKVKSKVLFRLTRRQLICSSLSYSWLGENRYSFTIYPTAFTYLTPLFAP